MTDLHRRTFLRGTLAGGVLTLAASAGLLRPARVLAAEWPKSAFESKQLDQALQNLFGSAQLNASDQVRIKAPLQAENGAVVPVTVSAEMPGVQAISILVEKNNQPLIAHVALQGADSYFSGRIKMAQSSDVYVVCQAGGRLYSARQSIKVTIGGCGG